MKFDVSKIGIVLMLAAFMMIIARWYHPATFSDVVVNLAFITGVILIAIQLLLSNRHGRKN